MSRRSRFDRDETLKVLVDMDMVLCDFEGQVIENFRKKYPEDPFIPLDQRNGFFVRVQYGKLREDLADKVRSVYNAEGFMLSLKEIDGAVAAVKEMNKMENVRVFICTSPLVVYDYCLKEKFQWVEEHIGKEWLDKIVITSDKTLVHGHLLIDDRPNIEGAIRKPSWEHILFTACHNINAKVGNKRRLENWTDGSWRDIIIDFQKRI